MKKETLYGEVNIVFKGTIMSKLEDLQLNRIRLYAYPKNVFDVANIKIGVDKKVKCLECGGEMSLL